VSNVRQANTKIALQKAKHNQFVIVNTVLFMDDSSNCISY
jgi:hypothetical protein